MASFLDNKRVTRTLYLAITEPDICVSLSLGRTPPLCHKNPLTLCTCRRCYRLTKTVMEKHGHDLTTWVSEPDGWR